MRNNKGAITIIVLATTLFMIAFLISTYTILANRRQTQAEVKRETRGVYEKDLNNLEEIYSNYYAEAYDAIPIYSADELLQVASGKDVVIGGKIYNLSESAKYKLMNNIDFYTRDYAEEYPDSFEQFEVTDEVTGEIRTAYNWIDIEEQIINGTFTGNFEYNGNKVNGRNDIVVATAIEYIQSTGTQYIDTGITPDQDTKVEIEVSLDSLYSDGNSNKGIMGTRTSGESNAYHLIAGGGGSETEALFSGYGTTNTMVTSETLSLERNVKYTIIKDKNITTINDTAVATADAQNFEAPYPLVIFAVRNGSTTPEFYGSMKLYYCKIYQEDELVRDFIPVLNPEGVPCLYDKVTKQYFYNNGEGTFQYINS